MSVISLHAERVDDVAILRFPGLARLSGLVHAVTTKPWNMAPHRDADREACIARRRRLCEHLGMPFERLTAPDQIHGHHVLRVMEADVGAGRLGRETAMRFVDGLVCDLPATPIIQLSGDCPLVLVYDPKRHCLGTAHASWRGTVGGIAGRLVERMAAEFGSDPADLWAGVAPCASAERYEVGPEVRRIARTLLPQADRFFPTRDGRIMFDLKAANADQLQRAGVPPDKIEVAAECTIADERFYSHRRDGAATGRFALLAGLRG